MAEEYDAVDRFRAASRRTHVLIFLVFSMILSAISFGVLIFHVMTGIDILLPGLYVGFLALVTSIPVISSIYAANISISELPAIYSELSRKFKFLVGMYLWFGVGFIGLYTATKFGNQQLFFPSHLTSPLVGVVLIIVSVQSLFLYYFIFGSIPLSGDELQEVKKSYEDEFEDFDPDDYDGSEVDIDELIDDGNE